ncbi:MAG: FAD-dependent oxidoreductase, partial [Pyrobaculum sp.]
MTPVAGINMSPPRYYYDGLLIVGDAAGFLLHTGVLIRGVDFAIASGVLAAEAIKEARSPSAEDLAIYEKKLRESFVLQQLEKFRSADRLLSDESLFRDLALLSTEAAYRYFNIDHNHRTMFEAVREASKKTRVNMLKIMINMIKMLRSL